MGSEVQTRHAEPRRLPQPSPWGRRRREPSLGSDMTKLAVSSVVRPRQHGWMVSSLHLRSHLRPAAASADHRRRTRTCQQRLGAPRSGARPSVASGAERYADPLALERILRAHEEQPSARLERAGEVANAATGSSKNIMPNRLITTSKDPASKRCTCASAWSRSIMSQPAAATRRRAGSSMAAEMSTPTTRPEGHPLRGLERRRAEAAAHVEHPLARLESSRIEHRLAERRDQCLVRVAELPVLWPCVVPVLALCTVDLGRRSTSRRSRVSSHVPFRRAGAPPAARRNVAVTTLGTGTAVRSRTPQARRTLGGVFSAAPG